MLSVVKKKYLEKNVSIFQFFNFLCRKIQATMKVNNYQNYKEVFCEKYNLLLK